MRKNLLREGRTKFVHNDLLWYKLQDKSLKKGLHHVCFPVQFSVKFLDSYSTEHLRTADPIC